MDEPDPHICRGLTWGELQRSFTHAGWVPCISGRLLFRFFSCDHPRGTGHLTVNHLEPGRDELIRFVVLSAEIDWKDVDREDRLRAGQTADGAYRVALTGTKRDSHEHFEGRVTVIPAAQIRSDSGRSHTAEWQAVAEQLRLLRGAAAKSQRIAEHFARLDQLLAALQSPESYRVPFVVEPKGFCFLKLDGTDEKSRDPLSREAVHAETVIRQTFYFIKFALHRHQHHDNSDDSLTTVHRLPAAPAELGPVLVNDLRLSLVQLKRNFDALSYSKLFEARGIAAYTASLIESCRSAGLLSARDHEHEKAYFSNTAQSLSISAEAIERKKTKALLLWSNARSLLLFVFSIVAPLVIVFGGDIRSRLESLPAPQAGTTSPQLFIDAAAWILSGTTNLVAIILLTILGFWVYASFHAQLTEPLLTFRRFARFAEQITYDWRKAVIVCFSALSLSVALIVFALYMLFS